MDRSASDSRKSLWTVRPLIHVKFGGPLIGHDPSLASNLCHFSLGNFFNKLMVAYSLETVELFEPFYYFQKFLVTVPSFGGLLHGDCGHFLSVLLHKIYLFSAFHWKTSFLEALFKQISCCGNNKKS